MQTATAFDRSNAYYALAKPILIEMRENAESQYTGNGYLLEKITSMKWHLQSLAELDDGNNHEIEQHYVWLLGAAQGIEIEIRAYDNPPA